MALDPLALPAGSPVFVCGHGYSGTTLLLSLLDGHPDLLAFPEETRFYSKVLGHPDRRSPDYVLNHTGAKVFRPRPAGGDPLPPYVATVNPEDYAERLRSRWATGDGSERALLESLVLAYGDASGQAHRRYWVEKTPGTEAFLPRLIAAWPDLRAIYIIRDPRSVYCSARKARVVRSRTLPLEDFVVFWRDSVRAWQQFSAGHSNGLLIRYDDLVQEPRQVMQGVCDFLGIEWNDSLLRPTTGGVDRQHTSLFGATFSQVSTEPLTRYRTCLTPAEIRFIEAALGRLMTDYGWLPDYGRASLPGRARELLAGGSRNPRLKLRMIRGLLRPPAISP